MFRKKLGHIINPNKAVIDELPAFDANLELYQVDVVQYYNEDEKTNFNSEITFLHHVQIFTTGNQEIPMELLSTRNLERLGKGQGHI